MTTKKLIEYRDLGLGWRKAFEFGPDGQIVGAMPEATLILAACAAGATAAETAAERASTCAATLLDVLGVLREIRDRLPPPPRPADVARADLARESASRRRAMEAYVRAGGTGADTSQSAALPVRDLRLSHRAFQACRRLGVATAGELAEKSASELLALRNVGGTTLEDVRRALRGHGLALAGESLESEGGEPA